MTTKTENPKLTITMTDRAPVTITKENWPAIASASWHSGAIECQANEIGWLKVREHRDGRRIVYGARDSGLGGMPAGYRGKAAGFLVDSSARIRSGEGTGCEPDGAETIRAIRRVAGLLDLGELGNELIADLPAEELV